MITETNATPRNHLCIQQRHNTTTQKEGAEKDLNLYLAGKGVAFKNVIPSKVVKIKILFIIIINLCNKYIKPYNKCYNNVTN